MASLPLTLVTRDTMSFASLSQCVLLCFTRLLLLVQAGPQQVPIGAVFDSSPGEMASALKWQLYLHNDNKATSFKLNSNIQMMSGRADGFSISTAICNQMRRGTFALMGTHNANTINTIKSFSSTFHMPFITPSIPSNLSGQQHNYEIYMQPLYTKAIIEFMDSVNWRKVYYVYLYEEGLRRLEQLFNTMAKEDIHIEVEVKRVISVNDAIETLARLDMRTEDMDKRVILDLPKDETNEFFGSLQRKALRKVRFHYLLAGLDINMINLEKFKHGGLNITGYRIVDYHNQTVKSWIDSGWAMLHEETWPGGGVKKISFQQAMIADGVSVLIKALQELVIHQPNVFKSALNTKKKKVPTATLR